MDWKEVRERRIALVEKFCEKVNAFVPNEKNKNSIRKILERMRGVGFITDGELSAFLSDLEREDDE
jgi:hypothetical protein